MSRELFLERLQRRLPRLLASGVDYNDAMSIASRATELKDWTRLWSDANAVSAGEAYARAAVYLHAAQSVSFDDRQEKDHLQRRQQEVAGRGLAFLRPPGRIIDVPFENFAFPARLRIPAAGRRSPCVILTAGADST